MKNKIFVTLALLLILLVLLQGCGKKSAAPEGPEETTEVDDDLSDLDDIEEDLSMDELENLDKELEEINW